MVESRDGKAIELKRQSSEGTCEVECNTIAQACKDVMQEAGIHIAAGLFKSFTLGGPNPLMRRSAWREEQVVVRAAVRIQAIRSKLMQRSERKLLKNVQIAKTKMTSRTIKKKDKD